MVQSCQPRLAPWSGWLLTQRGWLQLAEFASRAVLEVRSRWRKTTKQPLFSSLDSSSSSCTLRSSGTP